MNRRSSVHGMVLLEVIVALTIFTGVAFALVMALDAATEAGTDRNRVDAATLGLENRMAQLANAPLAPTRRDLPADPTGIVYHLDVAPETLEDANRKSFSGFYRVTLRASWGPDRDKELSQLFYQP
jgi:hypothetical protein